METRSASGEHCRTAVVEPQGTKGGLVVTHTVSPSLKVHNSKKEDLRGTTWTRVKRTMAWTSPNPRYPLLSSDAEEGPGGDPHPDEQEQVDMGLGPPGAGPKIRQYLSSNCIRSLTLLSVQTRGGVEPGLS